jgi:hypothetical protein
LSSFSLLALRPDLGSVPSWLSAVGTIGAVSIALGQVAWDRKIRRNEAKTAAARRVAGWVSGDDGASTLITV